jgi:hypothetical protein
MRAGDKYPEFPWLMCITPELKQATGRVNLIMERIERKYKP